MFGYEVGSGRLVPTVVAVLGLASVIIGWRAVFRPGAPGAWAAMLAGLFSVAVGGVHAANAAGGLGTGNGLAGAVIAVGLGVLGAACGVIAVTRARRRAGEAAAARRPG
ncbi:DUF6223 family protein [Actinoplanes sp. NPDC024001]|uniref:DUF6223 family protein n=1 Tax=Actinoplanes sp. NPDC024001 TaxID=3154598 RepID=UPI0033FD7C2A